MAVPSWHGHSLGRAPTSTHRAHLRLYTRALLVIVALAAMHVQFFLTTTTMIQRQDRFVHEVRFRVETGSAPTRLLPCHGSKTSRRLVPSHSSPSPVLPCAWQRSSPTGRLTRPPQAQSASETMLELHQVLTYAR